MNCSGCHENFPSSFSSSQQQNCWSELWLSVSLLSKFYRHSSSCKDSTPTISSNIFQSTLECILYVTIKTWRLDWDCFFSDYLVALFNFFHIESNVYCFGRSALDKALKSWNYEPNQNGGIVLELFYDIHHGCSFNQRNSPRSTSRRWRECLFRSCNPQGILSAPLGKLALMAVQIYVSLHTVGDDSAVLRNNTLR